jgi:hypothetical protein
VLRAMQVLTALIPSESMLLMSRLLAAFSKAFGQSVQASYLAVRELHQELRFSAEKNVSGSDLNLFVASSTCELK